MTLRGTYRVFFALLLIGIAGQEARSQSAPSVLAQGNWLKVPVSTDGFHKITVGQLQSAGWNTNNIAPDQIQLYGYGGGMLPQSLDSLRYTDLPENAIWIQGGADGQLNEEDYILFYGQSPHRLRYRRSGSQYALDYQKNLYADSTYYFLTVGTTSGKRITSDEASASSSFTTNTFDDYVVYENEEFNLRKPDAGSGRAWFGETMTSGAGLEFTLGNAVWSDTRDATVTVTTLGTATEPTKLTVSLNEQALGALDIPAIDTARYADKGVVARATFTASAATLPASRWQIGFQYQGSRAAYLDKFTVEGARPLRYQQEGLSFRSMASTQHNHTTFEIATGTTDLVVWDVTHPLRPVRQSGTYDGTRWKFVTTTQDTLKEFVAIDPADVPAVRRVRSVANQNLKDGQVPHLVIVTPPAFQPEAERLAALRRNHDGLDVRVVALPQIYHEFSSGRQDISAIRNYMKYLYDTDSSRLQHLLLFGKGSYDYLGYLPYNTNFVPTYQSRDATHPIYSYSSDDYYAFLEAGEGYWEESFAGDHTMDIGVGRLPVKSVEEARIMVDKLVHYATGEATRGRWRSEVVLVADDGDRNKHQRDAEQLAQRLDTKHPAYGLNKIYLGAFEQESTASGGSSVAAARQIEQVLKQGALVVNFTGHGSETRWTQENIFNLNTISELRNYDRLPFFVTATCEFGRHDDPSRVSGAEQLVLSENGGAIGLVTTARPVFSNSNLLLNRAFYEQVFAVVEGESLTIGEIFRRTKNEALNGRVNRNFSLLGDPSMKLVYPTDRVALQRAEVRQADGSYAARDTLMALDRVRLRGEVLRRSNGERYTDFDGVVTVEVVDKSTTTEISDGDTGLPMQFEERNAVLHRGQARVRNGQFTLHFVMPQNIIDEPGLGRLMAYAQREGSDAHGADLSVVIGGRSVNAVADDRPPQVALFIDDSTFVDGGITTDRPTLLAHLQDENGIGLFSTDPDRTMSATLVHQETATTRQWALSEFYETEVDTYQSGQVIYPFDKLDNGHYTLTLRVADTYGNVTEEETRFVVGDQTLQLLEVYNYPNPFSRETTFVIDHNRPGDDLALHIRIVDQQGRVVEELRQDFLNSNTRLQATWWGQATQPDQVLPPDLYVARILVWSLTDQVASEKFHKLIISP